MVCSFELAGVPLVDSEVTETFPPLANGDMLQSITGHLTMQLTNADTGKSIVLNVSGPGSTTTHPDGSTTVVGRGETLGFAFPTDVPAGRGHLPLLGPRRVELHRGRAGDRREPQRAPPRHLRRAFGVNDHRTPWPALGNIQAPTLLVAGEHESTHLIAACTALQNGRIVVLPGLGHVGAFVHREVVLPHVLPFLGSVAHS